MASSLAVILMTLQCVQYTAGLNIPRYSESPVQYHIQTDLGGDLYFRFQTYNGQWRKEKRLRDGKVIGAYGWTDDEGILRLYDYLADENGYRVVRERSMKVADEAPSPEGPLDGVPSRRNKFRSNQPNALNSLRRKTFEKVRKRSHGKEAHVEAKPVEETSDALLSSVNPSPSDGSDIADSAAQTNDLTAGNVDSLKNANDLLLTQNKPNLEDFNSNNLMIQNTNTLNVKEQLGKSMLKQPDSLTNDIKKPTKLKQHLKNGRYLMRGKKLSLFDDVDKSKEQNEPAENSFVDQKPQEHSTNPNTSNTDVHIDRSDNNDPEATRTVQQTKQNLDVRYTVSRPKVSMSRLLRSQSASSSRDKETPTDKKPLQRDMRQVPTSSKSRRRQSLSGRGYGLRRVRVLGPSSPDPEEPDDLLPAESVQDVVTLVESPDSSLMTSSSDSQVNYVRRKRKPTLDDRKQVGVANGRTTIDFDAGNQFHYEVVTADGSRVGRHGYVDPMGFLRVTDYVSSSAGHTENRSSTYVGSRVPGAGNYRI